MNMFLDSDQTDIVVFVADDGFNVSFHIDSNTQEVDEVYFGGVDFRVYEGFMDSLYVISDENPVSLSALISKVNTEYPELLSDFEEDQEAEKDYEAGSNFYFNNGRL